MPKINTMKGRWASLGAWSEGFQPAFLGPVALGLLRGRVKVRYGPVLQLGSLNPGVHEKNVEEQTGISGPPRRDVPE